MSGSFTVGRTFKLDFTGTDLDGAEVTFRSMSVGALAEILIHGEDDAAAQLLWESNFLEKYLVSWNLEDADGPLPADAEGLRALEEPAYKLITREYLKATRGVTAPLDHRSSGGERSAEQSIPMEIA